MVRTASKGRWLLGYSLIELIVVLAVMGVVAMISLFGLKSFNNDQLVINAQREFVNNIRAAQNKVINGNTSDGVVGPGESAVQVFVPRVGGLNSYWIGSKQVDMPKGVTFGHLNSAQLGAGKDAFICLANPNSTVQTSAPYRPCNNVCCTESNPADCQGEKGFYCNGDNSFDSSNAPFKVSFTNGRITKYVLIDGSGFFVTRIYAQ